MFFIRVMQKSSFLPVVGVLLVAGAGFLLWRVLSNPVTPSLPGENNVSTSEQNSELKTYTQAGKFTIQYPSDFSVETAEGLGGAFLDTSHVKLAFPESAFSEEVTNYGEAYVVISSSVSEEEVITCTKFENIGPHEEVEKPSEKSINGVIFATQAAMEAAAGNLYNSELYRTVHNGVCYEISLTVHTGNIYNYDPPIKEFDQRRAFDVLEKIADTFRFLE